ncbi:hypothetical protein CBFG_01189 [Clostridiales bacterium 1_7_47FAA]|nr:hypothetical protein CBFG_01189 [Clostridiales bacterium 1_7_47FAA]
MKSWISPKGKDVPRITFSRCTTIILRSVSECRGPGQDDIRGRRLGSDTCLRPFSVHVVLRGNGDTESGMSLICSRDFAVACMDSSRGHIRRTRGNDACMVERAIYRTGHGTDWHTL